MSGTSAPLEVAIEVCSIGLLGLCGREHSTLDAATAYEGFATLGLIFFGVLCAARSIQRVALRACLPEGRTGHAFCLHRALRQMVAVLSAFLLTGAAMAETDRPLAPLDVSSPAATLQSFLTEARAIEAAYVAYLADADHAGMRKFDTFVQRTGALFDTRHVPPATRTEVAGTAFGFLYDILLRLPPEDLAAALTATNDTDPQSPWVIPNTPITIVRIDEGEEVGSWLFSSRTLSRLPELHRAIIDIPPQQPSAIDNWHLSQSNLSGPLFTDDVIHRLPSFLTHMRVLDTPLWKLFLTLAMWLSVALAVLMWMQLLVRLTSRLRQPARMLARLSAPALTAVLVLAARDFAQMQINLSGAAFAQVERSVTLLALYLVAAWAAWLTILGMVEAVVTAPMARDNPYHTNLLRLLGKVLALASVVCVAILGLNEVGVPALGLVAGLGASGFAIALAARSTVENLFGGLTLFADKPFRIGDFINYQDGTGVLESIGPRSSRLRGLDGTLTTVPNTDLATVRITNYSERNHCLFQHRFGLRYETTHPQLLSLITAIRDMLEGHPMVEKAAGTPRVHLVGFGDTALMLEVRANVLTSNYPVFLNIQQELLFTIMGLVEKCGSRLATRTHTVLLGRDGGLSPPIDNKDIKQGAGPVTKDI